MLHKIIFILLLPLMFIQGRRVKKNTPKLPEAGGERSGCLGEGHAVSLLVLGDSAAAGVGVAQQKDALSGTISSGLSAHFEVSWQLIAKSGANTAQTLKMLNKRYNEQAFEFDIVVVSLGVNDVISPLSAREWVQQQLELIEFLTQSVNCRKLILTQVPPMGSFPALPQPLRWFLGKRSDEFNGLLRQLSKSEPFTLLDFGSKPEPAQMASDGFHPGKLIYQHWGDSIVAAIGDKLVLK